MTSSQGWRRQEAGRGGSSSEHVMDTQKPSVLIFNGREIPSNELKFFTFPHPKDGGIVFCVVGSDMYEVQRVQPRKYGSWFIDERVSSDPSYLMASKFDPKFLLLPFLERSTRFSPLDQVVSHVDGCDRIPLQNCGQWNLGDICDINDQLGEDMILYRLNMDKTMAWLKKKVDGVAAYLCKKRLKNLELQVSTFNAGAQSSQGKDHREDKGDGEQRPETEDIVEALGVICDFLTETLADKLLSSFDVSKEYFESKSQSTKKRKAAWETALEVEKETLSYGSMGSSSASTTSDKNKSSGGSSVGKGHTQKKLAAASTKKVEPVKGAGSILSFFGKKK